MAKLHETSLTFPKLRGGSSTPEIFSRSRKAVSENFGFQIFLVFSGSDLWAVSRLRRTEKIGTPEIFRALQAVSDFPQISADFLRQRFRRFIFCGYPMHKKKIFVVRRDPRPTFFGFSRSQLFLVFADILFGFFLGRPKIFFGPCQL